METKILSKLDSIEEQYNIQILYACEAGSRAWGFESPDSDYDIRFIYKHRNKDNYLSLLEPKHDVIDIPIDENNLDLHGWDIKKSLNIMHKSNIGLSEWLYSPIHYITTNAFEELKKMLNRSYSLTTASYHYIHIAKNNYPKIDREYNLKKYMYCLREFLCLEWIATFKEIPPINLEELAYDISASSEREYLHNLVKEAITLKKSETEKSTKQPTAEMLKLIETLNEQHGGESFDYKEKPNIYKDINDLFRWIVNTNFYKI